MERYNNLSEKDKKKYKPPVRPKIIFCDTQVEFPEHYEFIKEQENVIRSLGYEVYKTKPETTFFQIVKEKGFPMFGKAIRKDKNPVIWEKIKSLDIRTCGNYCCQKLKEEPSVKLYKELNIDYTFMGILADESYTRMTRWYGLGDIYYNKTEDIFKVTPLIHFDEEDIWDYIKKYNVPTSPIYSMGYWKSDNEGNEEFVTYKRTGCWTCAMNITFEENNMEMLRNTHPNLWELIMVKKGLAKEVFKFKHSIKESHWTEQEVELLNRYLEVKPCHFDRVS